MNECEHIKQSPYGLAVAGTAIYAACPWCEIKALSFKLDSCRRDAIQECWDAIDKHIARGTLACAYRRSL